MTTDLHSPQAAWAVRQLVYGEILDQLGSHFRTLQIRYMPIKGAYLILSGLSERIATRRMVDIDIIVDKENIEAAWKFFCGLENVRANVNAWDFEKSFFYRFAEGEFHIELHLMLNRTERFRLLTEELFARAVKKDAYLHLPSPEDAATITVCHALVHVAYWEINDAVMGDLAAITAVRGFDWLAFEQRCARARVLRFCRFLGAVCPDQARTMPGFPRPGRFTRHYACLYRLLYRRIGHGARHILFELVWVKHPVALIRVGAAARRRRVTGL